MGYRSYRRYFDDRDANLIVAVPLHINEVDM